MDEETRALALKLVSRLALGEDVRNTVYLAMRYIEKNTPYSVERDTLVGQLWTLIEKLSGVKT